MRRNNFKHSIAELKRRSGEGEVVAEDVKPATKENRKQLQAKLGKRRGGLKAVEAAKTTAQMIL